MSFIEHRHQEVSYLKAIQMVSRKTKIHPTSNTRTQAFKLVLAYLLSPFSFFSSPSTHSFYSFPFPLLLFSPSFLPLSTHIYVWILKHKYCMFYIDRKTEAQSIKKFTQINRIIELNDLEARAFTSNNWAFYYYFLYHL